MKLPTGVRAFLKENYGRRFVESGHLFAELQNFFAYDKILLYGKKLL